jgi:Raf kinase inhibitor-like YbhB/YbcL family protein
MLRSRLALIGLTLGAVGVIAAGCGGDDESTADTGATEPPPDVQMAPEPGVKVTAIELTSSAFSEREDIPVEFTCDGAGVSPPLAWAEVSPDVGSLALLLQDRDAPGGTFLDWSVFDISAGDSMVRKGSAPAGSVEGEDSFGESGYGAPCPPQGASPHDYEFRLYVPTESPGLAEGASANEAVSEIEGSAIDSAGLTASFER